MNRYRLRANYEIQNIDLRRKSNEKENDYR